MLSQLHTIDPTAMCTPREAAAQQAQQQHMLLQWLDRAAGIASQHGRAETTALLQQHWRSLQAQADQRASVQESTPVHYALRPQAAPCQAVAPGPPVDGPQCPVARGHNYGCREGAGAQSRLRGAVSTPVGRAAVAPTPSRASPSAAHREVPTSPTSRSSQVGMRAMSHARACGRKVSATTPQHGYVAVARARARAAHHQHGQALIAMVMSTDSRSIR